MSRFSLFLCFVFSWSCSVQSTKKQTSGSKHERCSVKCLHGSGVVAHRDLRSCSAPAAADAEIKVPMVRLYMMIFNTRDTTYSCQHVWIIRMFQTGTDSICSSKDSLAARLFSLDGTDVLSFGSWWFWLLVRLVFIFQLLQCVMLSAGRPRLHWKESLLFMPPGSQHGDNEARFNQQNLSVCVCVCFDFEQENEKTVWASSFQSLGR